MLSHAPGGGACALNNQVSLSLHLAYLVSTRFVSRQSYCSPPHKPRTTSRTASSSLLDTNQTESSSEKERSVGTRTTWSVRPPHCARRRSSSESPRSSPSRPLGPQNLSSSELHLSPLRQSCWTCLLRDLSAHRCAQGCQCFWTCLLRDRRSTGPPVSSSFDSAPVTHLFSVLTTQTDKLLSVSSADQSSSPLSLDRLLDVFDVHVRYGFVLTATCRILHVLHDQMELFLSARGHPPPLPATSSP